jgi:hypothetical protein
MQPETSNRTMVSQKLLIGGFSLANSVSDRRLTIMSTWNLTACFPGHHPQILPNGTICEIV